MRFAWSRFRLENSLRLVVSDSTVRYGIPRHLARAASNAYYSLQTEDRTGHSLLWQSRCQPIFRAISETSFWGVLFSAVTKRFRENDRHYSFSLTRKHDNFAFFVFDDANPNLSWGFADSSIPEKTVCLLA